MQETAMVLGAGGFLGRYICREYLQAGHRVVGVGRSRSLPEETSDFVQGDLRELDLATLFAEEHPRWIINAAGGSSVGESFADPHGDWMKTVFVQARVLEALRQSEIDAFYIFLSSAAVYGEPTRLPIREEDPCKPISPYGMHKWQAEILQQEYGEHYGLRGATLRIFSAYGEGLRKQVVYELSQKIQQAATHLEVMGTGEETRDFIHAADVARAVNCIATKEAEGIYNVASGQQTSIAELARALVERQKPDLQIVFSGRKKTGNPIQWHADVTKLRQMQFCCIYTMNKKILLKD